MNFSELKDTVNKAMGDKKYAFKAMIEHGFSDPDPKLATQYSEANKELCARYKKYRKICTDLVNDKIPQYIDKKRLTGAGKLLGMARGNQLYFEEEADVGILFDFVNFHYYLGMDNAANLFFKANKDKLIDDEKFVAACLTKAQLSLLVILKPAGQNGVLVLDLFSNQKMLLIDINLSKSAIPGLALLTTVINDGDFVVTSGASMMASNMLDKIAVRFKHYLQKGKGRWSAVADFPPAIRTEFAGKVVKQLLRDGNSRLKHVELS